MFSANCKSVCKTCKESGQLPNGHDPEWTRSRINTIPNGHDPESTPSRMDTIPNGHHPEWTQSRRDTIMNGYNSEYIVTEVLYAYAKLRELDFQTQPLSDVKVE